MPKSIDAAIFALMSLVLPYLAARITASVPFWYSPAKTGAMAMQHASTAKIRSSKFVCIISHPL